MNRLLTIYRRSKTNKLADTLIMVISDAGKAIIKHCHEIGHTVCKIWKDNPEKHWDKTSMKRLIKRFEAFVTMGKAKRFWPSANSNNSWKRRRRRGNDLFSRRSSRHSCAPKNIAEGLKILQSSVRRMIKRKSKKVQTSQNTSREWCHSKKESKTCWLSAWKIRNKSTNDWARSFSSWK